MKIRKLDLDNSPQLQEHNALGIPPLDERITHPGEHPRALALPRRAVAVVERRPVHAVLLEPAPHLVAVDAQAGPCETSPALRSQPAAAAAIAIDTRWVRRDGGVLP